MSPVIRYAAVLHIEVGWVEAARSGNMGDQAVPGHVVTGHERSAGRRTHRAGIGLGKGHAVGREGHHVGRLVKALECRVGHQLSACWIDHEGHRGVVHAHVVDEKEDDVGSRWSGTNPDRRGARCTSRIGRGQSIDRGGAYIYSDGTQAVGGQCSDVARAGRETEGGCVGCTPG